MGEFLVMEMRAYVILSIIEHISLLLYCLFAPLLL